jgi:hypothetical protein
MRNSAKLKIAARASALKVFADSPESCGGGAGMGSVSLQQSSKIENLNTDPVSLQLFVAGSPTVSSSVSFENTGSASENTAMAIYAPNSTFLMQNHMQITGAVVAKTVQLENNTTLTYDGRVEGAGAVPAARIFQNPQWVECTSNQGTGVESGC